MAGALGRVVAAVVGVLEVAVVDDHDLLLGDRPHLGGVVLEFSYPQKANLEKTREALQQAGYGEAQVQNFGDEHSIMVRLLPHEKQDVNAVSKAVTDALRHVDPSVELWLLARRRVARVAAGPRRRQAGVRRGSDRSQTCV